MEIINPPAEQNGFLESWVEEMMMQMKQSFADEMKQMKERFDSLKSDIYVTKNVNN